MRFIFIPSKRFSLKSICETKNPNTGKVFFEEFACILKRMLYPYAAIFPLTHTTSLTPCKRLPLYAYPYRVF